LFRNDALGGNYSAFLVEKEEFLRAQARHQESLENRVRNEIEWLRRGPKALRLEVVDGGPGEPAPRTPHRAGRPGGHGMFIVQRLCLDWGVVRDDGRPGKTVWAELAAPS